MYGKMHTNENKTFEILGGYLMDNNEINAESLASEVTARAENDENFYREIINTRRKTRNVAIEALMNYVNYMLKYSGYPTLYATNAQVIKFDRAHGGSLERVLDIVEADIIETRAEYYE